MVRLEAELGQQRPGLLGDLPGYLRGERLEQRHGTVEERPGLVHLTHRDPGPE